MLLPWSMIFFRVKMNGRIFKTLLNLPLKLYAIPSSLKVLRFEILKTTCIIKRQSRSFNQVWLWKPIFLTYHEQLLKFKPIWIQNKVQMILHIFWTIEFLNKTFITCWATKFPSKNWPVFYKQKAICMKSIWTLVSSMPSLMTFQRIIIKDSPIVLCKRIWPFYRLS